MHIFWDITRECNLKCVHCYNAPDRAKSPPDLELEGKEQLLRELALAHRGATLHLLGGEPTLVPHFERIVEVAQSLGFELEITTNGLDEAISYAATLSRAFAKIHVSLDGATARTNDLVRGSGTFSKIRTFLGAIDEARRASGKAWLDLSFTLTRQTLGEAGDLVALACSARASSLTVQPVKLLGNAVRSERKFGVTAVEYLAFAEELARYSVGEPITVSVTGGSQRMKDYIRWKYFKDIVAVEAGCDAGTGQLRVSSTGTVEACIVSHRISTASIQTQGDLVHGNAPNATSDWTTRIQRKSILLHSINVQRQPPICLGCEHFANKRCYGGCAVQATFGPAQICEILQSEPKASVGEGK